MSLGEGRGARGSRLGQVANQAPTSPVGAAQAGHRAPPRRAGGGHRRDHQPCGLSARLVEPFGHHHLLLDSAVHAPELRHPVRLPGGGGTLVALRTDAESALDAISEARHVVTDRAHVLLDAALLGRSGEYADGGYWKNRAMAEQTFGSPFVGRVRHRRAAELLGVAVAAC